MQSQYLECSLICKPAIFFDRGPGFALLTRVTTALPFGGAIRARVLPERKAMRITAFLLSCLLSVLLACAAFAQDPQAQTAPRKQGRHKAKNLQQMDANSDGQIVRDEWKGRPKGFDRLDANHDGVIARDEIASLAREQARAGLEKLDANKDQRIGRDEWKGRPRGFDKLDADRDGFLTTDELSKRRRRG
jgi:Ca2+-binding EF-hand superfamily protein